MAAVTVITTTITTETAGIEMAYICLDIETSAVEGAALQREIDLLKPASNIKDEAKKEQNLKTKKELLIKKSALTDSAPVSCVGGKTPTGIFSITNFKFGFEDELLDAGIESRQCNDEKELLTDLSILLSHYGDDTEIITFNGKNFDLPKLRMAYARNDIRIPELLKPKCRHVDLMREFCYNFSQTNTPFVSMSEVLIKLGIMNGKQLSGKIYPEMIKEDKYLEAVLYNVIDCYMTEQIYFRLM